MQILIVSMLVPVLIQLSKAFLLTKRYWSHKTPIQTAKYTMASWLKSTVLVKNNTCIWPTLCNHRIQISLHCCFFRVFCFCFFTLSLELLNGLRSAVGLTQRIPPFGDSNYDRAWFYDLSLQHPPTLWARSEGSSVSIGHFCTALEGRFTPRQNYKKWKISSASLFWPCNWAHG